MSERKTKRADELKPGDVTAAGELLDNPAEVLYASTYGPNGSRPVTLLVFREVGSTRPLTDEINPAAEFELADAGEPSVWADIAAELHKLADDALLLVGEPAPSSLALDILPGKHDDPESVTAVDRVGLALLGKTGETVRMTSGTYHHMLRGRRGRVGIGIFQQVPSPSDGRDAELERLRAENEQLRAAVSASSADPTGFEFSREVAPEDGALVDMGRVEPHTGGVTDGGLVEAEPVKIRHYHDPSSDVLLACNILAVAVPVGEWITPDRKRVTCPGCVPLIVELAHAEALDADVRRAKAEIIANLREGEHGRITNPGLARFLAERENKRRGLVDETPPIAKHYDATGWATRASGGASCACGVTFNLSACWGKAVEQLALHIADANEVDGALEVADGHVVHECCGKLDDGPHESFCARYVPPTDPADLPQPVVHVSLDGSRTACGWRLNRLPEGQSYVRTWSDPSTCLKCADEAPF